MSESDRADPTDSTGAGDRLGGDDDLRVLPDGVVRLSDPNVRATARDEPPAVAWPIAHRGRVTLLRGPEKEGKSALLRAAVAAVTGGRRFLEQATIGGSVLWVSQEAAADLKRQLAEVSAHLHKVFFVRGLRTATDDEPWLPQIVASLRPMWVIIDPWHHYLQLQRVTAAAGPGAERLLLADIVDWARAYDVAVTVSHDNDGNCFGASTDSEVLGAADMVVSFGPGKSPTTLRLQPSGRWRVDSVEISGRRGLNYAVVRDTEQASRSRTDEQPIDERVVLHLSKLGADTRLAARGLVASLGCGGRRYDELREALERLLAEGIVDHAQRAGRGTGRGRGYALTERGRRWAECLRRASDSGASTNRKASAACSTVVSVSEATLPGVNQRGNATMPARETSAGGCSESVSAAAFPAVGGSGNAMTPAGETSAEGCSESVSAAAFPAVGGSGNAMTPAGEASAEGCSESVSAAAFPVVGGNGNAMTPAGDASAACSEVASVSGGAGHVGAEVVGDGRSEPARRRRRTRQVADLLLHLFRPNGASETRLMFTTVLTLFRLSGQSVEGVSAAFNGLVTDGFLQKIPSKCYPEPLYAITERGRRRVASLPKHTTW